MIVFDCLSVCPGVGAKCRELVWPVPAEPSLAHPLGERRGGGQEVAPAVKMEGGKETPLGSNQVTADPSVDIISG